MKKGNVYMGYKFACYEISEVTRNYHNRAVYLYTSGVLLFSDVETYMLGALISNRIKNEQDKSNGI